MKNLKKNTTVNFKRTTIAPCLEQLTPSTYRARVTIKGTRYYFNTTNKAKALKWIKLARTTGNPKVTV